jgi:NADPH-dependent glutamate synthase beta subunit-like oxidoreductase
MANPINRVPSIWTTGWTDILNTGTWRNAVAVHQKKPAPCYGACPVDGDIPLWIHMARSDDFKGAWQTLAENNPIPATIGRTCHHPCEKSCNRNEYDGAVSINALEQYVGDMAIHEGWAFSPPLEESDKRVAVIGGGPAGLSCAYQLRRKGFCVTIYDANPELGGVLRYGVPEFRLPKKVLDAEIRKIIDMGIDVVTERKLLATDLDELRKLYAAVFIAFGAHNPKKLPQFPTENSRVIDGLDFLRSVRSGAPLYLGYNVIVIGGGSVAMDIAGSAIRLGRSARIISLEGRDVMPAPEDEIQDVLDEGAVIIDGAMVKSVENVGAELILRCVKVELDPASPAGVIRPIELKDTEFNVKADTVILAVGQDPELAEWKEIFKVERSMVVVDGSYMTSCTGIFAAGDVAGSERFVSTAVGDGKRAANSIALYLGRQDEDEQKSFDQVPEVAFSEINTFYFPHEERREREKADALKRRADFREIRLGFSPEEAQHQAERCFSCGNCIECDNCFIFCPDMAIAKDSSIPLHYTVLDQYCKGCGCCLEECPRGAMGVMEESK